MLKEANSKLEEVLKGSKGRVRRLKDLLHRQSHVGQLSIASGFQPYGSQAPSSPTPDGLPSPWYLLEAAEEKAGAPATPGLAKTTVGSSHVDAKGNIRMAKKSTAMDPAKTLNKSLDSRRSSAMSRRSGPGSNRAPSAEGVLPADVPARQRDSNSGAAGAADTNTKTSTRTATNRGLLTSAQNHRYL